MTPARLQYTSNRDPTLLCGWVFRSLLALGLLLIALRPCSADRYDEIISRVQSLAESKNIRLLEFGQTSQGRSIPAYLISDFTSDPANTARVMLVAGQHGDEINPVNAVLTYTSRLLKENNPSLLDKCIIIVAPMVNPDGIAANSRINSQRLNINRDWRVRQSSEARYTDSLIKRWQPQLILDLHEWMEQSPVPGNSIEVAAVSKISQSSAMSQVGERLADAAGLVLILGTRHSDRRLFHRHYSDSGYSSYLIETAVETDTNTKSNAYIVAIEQAINEITSDTVLRNVLSPASADFDVATARGYFASAETTSTANSRMLITAACILSVLCLIVWFFKPTPSSEIHWSRSYRKCGMDWEPKVGSLFQKRKLTPITARSWSHRRIRTRRKLDEASEQVS